VGIVANSHLRTDVHDSQVVIDALYGTNFIGLCEQQIPRIIRWLVKI